LSFYTEKKDKNSTKVITKGREGTSKGEIFFKSKITKGKGMTISVYQKNWESSKPGQ